MPLSVHEKREILSGALKIQKQIEQLYDKLEDLKVTGGLKSPSTCEPMRGGERLSACDMVSELQGTIDRLKEEKRLEAELIRRQIMKFDLDDRQENLLVLRYVNCYRWYVVASLLGIGRTHVHRLENETLSAIRL